LYSTGFDFVSKAFFFPITKTLITAFVCRDDGTLISVDTLQCWGSDHAPLIVAACVAILCYYPLASFVFPHTQFSDKHSDFKFNPTYVLGIAQLKLMITIAAVFLYDTPVALCFIAIAGFAGMMYLTHRMNPCLITWVNQVLLAIYTLSTAAMIATLVLVVSESHEAAFAVLGLLWGCIATGAACSCLWRRICSCKESSRPDLEAASDMPHSAGTSITLNELTCEELRKG